MDVARSPEHKKKAQQKRWATWGIVALVVIGITVYLSGLEPAAREVDEASVWIESVRRGEFMISVRGPGTLVPEEIRWIYPETDGLVEKRVIEAGTRVEPDSVILVLSNPELEQQVGDAKLQLAAAEAELADLKLRLDSNLLDQKANLASVKALKQTADLQAEADKTLNEEGLVPEINYRRSTLDAEQKSIRYGIEEERLVKTSESIDAQLEAKRTQVDQARAVYDLRSRQLEALSVKAGIRGVLQEIPIEVGQRVTPATNLARVAQPERLKAELRIPETQAKDVVVGLKAEIDTRNGIIPGRVTRIDPAVQNGSVLVDVRLEAEELPKGARPDLSVDGVVEIDRVEEATFVGRPAYGQAYGTVGMFKVGEDNIANRIPVKLGRLSVQYVEILGGLEVGDRVILSDSSQWDDVDRIRLR